ncbi:hypothetical protein SeMB42_g01162, partial [Synchytrium endobioticum]
MRGCGALTSSILANSAARLDSFPYLPCIKRSTFGLSHFTT